MSAERQEANLTALSHDDEPDLRMTGPEAMGPLPWYYRIAVTPVPRTASYLVMGMWVARQLGMHLLLPKHRPSMLIAGILWSVFAMFVCHCVYFAGTTAFLAAYSIYAWKPEDAVA